MVALGRPERLALGPTTGEPKAVISSRATLLPGILTATESPPVTAGKTLADLLRISVNGPGQNLPINVSASAGMSRVRTSR